MADRFPEAELVLDDELVYDEAPRRSTLLRRNDEQIVQEGEVLAGKYRVERIPGRSGLGVVVQVRHMELGQEVTLKFLVPDACAYPEFVQRFVREARSAVKIQGEHVARVTDVGRLESGAPYMVREYLRGPDLAEIIKVRGRLPVEEAVEYVIQACEGVAEGHALGVVHRNLKPTSLVVTRRSDGTPLVKVFDFAAAESLHVDPFTERAVSLVGTSAIMASLPYLSPEQIRDPHDVDVRADVYSLGAILFELLTGVPVYAADSAPALLAMVAADVAPPVRNFVPDLPGELDHVVLRCLSKNRALRYGSVAELVLALRSFASEDDLPSIERIVRLAKISKRPVEPGSQRSSSQPPAMPVAHASPVPPVEVPASPFTPTPSARAGRGPTGTMRLSLMDARTSGRREPAHDDVTAISPYAAYGLPSPAVVTAPLPVPSPPPARREASTTRESARFTPQPPPLRISVPPPFPNATPQPPPMTAVPPPEPRMPTSLPPRSSMSGLTRSWAVSDEPTAPLFTKKRLIGIGVVAACATLGGVLALRTSHSAPVAAAQPARPQPPAVAPPPVTPPAALPPTDPAAVAAAAASAAQVALAPAPAAPVPVAAPAPVAPAAPAPVVAAAPRAPSPAVAAAPAAVTPRPVAAVPAPARRPAPSKAGPAPEAAPEKVARAKSAPGQDLFDDPR